MELGTRVVVKIDGVRGFGSSFLEEAFGGLVRIAHFTETQLRAHLMIRADDKRFGVYKELIDRYIRDASLPAAG